MHNAAASDYAHVPSADCLRSTPHHNHATISLRTIAKVFPFSALTTADLVIDTTYEGGARGNAADERSG